MGFAYQGSWPGIITRSRTAEWAFPDDAFLAFGRLVGDETAAMRPWLVRDLYGQYLNL
jgi:hypothetical protein